MQPAAYACARASSFRVFASCVFFQVNKKHYVTLEVLRYGFPSAPNTKMLAHFHPRSHAMTLWLERALVRKQYAIYKIYFPNIYGRTRNGVEWRASIAERA